VKIKFQHTIQLYIICTLNLIPINGYSISFQGYKTNNPKQSMPIFGPILKFEETRYAVFISISQSSSIYQFPKSKDMKDLLFFLNEKRKKKASINLVVNQFDNRVIAITDEQ